MNSLILGLNITTIIYIHLGKNEKLSTDCKVFQDQYPVQVIRAVLAD